ncbi:hypothetical protein BDV95DRAFT_604161 [Massariosphaeria phaeospora]|uniref:Uncharacterized protein n=1 Tax=Massariosphaeria phaeospora TaxID=100035 RepID=A0A7C8M8T3_9PLEO|nr:hypothetical protein BDV95DRAFT_604161 [Massariosphaeria phaeospora]
MNGNWRDWNLGVFEVFIEELAQLNTERSSITELIRLSVFHDLDLRHTCCDIGRIQHDGEPRFDLQPSPRFDLEMLEAIKEEDDYLLNLLEELVPQFDAEYDAYGGSFTTFRESCYRPRMRQILKDLEEEDARKFRDAMFDYESDFEDDDDVDVDDFDNDNQDGSTS